MINYKFFQLLFLVSSMTTQMIGMIAEKQEIVEGIAQKIAELPKESQYNIFSLALELRENQKYELYKIFYVGSDVRGIALNANNTRVLTGSLDGIARLWDVKTGNLLIELNGHTDRISSVALSADGKIALTGSYDETVRVWNTLTGELITILQAKFYVTSLALSADARIAVIGTGGGFVRLYNPTTGELLNILEGHNDSISSVALSVDGSIALTGSYGGTARVWNTTTGETITVLQVGSRVTSGALSADGTSAVTGTGDNKVLVWDARSGTLLNTLLPTSSGFINSVALSKDEKRVFMSTDNTIIQVWNTQPLQGKDETNTLLRELHGHREPVKALVFGGDDFIASCSSDTTALIWKPYALAPQEPREHTEVLWQAYKKTFSRPKFLFPDEK